MLSYYVYITLYGFQITSAATVISGCSISINQDLGKPQPLLLLQNNATEDLEAFPLPTDDKGTVYFNSGEIINIACPKGIIILDGDSTLDTMTEAECISADRFAIGGKTVPFNTITCNKIPKHTARYTNQRCSGYDEIEIGFEVDDRFIRHILVCYDKDRQHSLYSKSTLSKSIGGYQRNFPRPDFTTGGFYNVKPDTVQNLYTRRAQRQTINQILDFPDNDTSVISETGNYYLARGHYTPKTDYVYGTQQQLTFYYVNVVPQWQLFNSGNWYVMESDYRRLAEIRELDLEIYTGSFGTTTLTDNHGNQQELYLWRYGEKKGIPVPHLIFKVLVEPKSKSAVVLVSVNNPYNEITEKDIICRDVCNQIDWLTWDRLNANKGYSYCCEMQDFTKIVKFLPRLDINKLLL